MAGPVYFVVQRGPGGAETPALYHDDLPPALGGKRAREHGLVWGPYRLDNNPIGQRWLRIAAVSLGDLMTIYERMRDRGELPPSNLAERRTAEMA